MGSLVSAFPPPCHNHQDCPDNRRGSPGNGPEHGHQGAMGILAVRQGVVKGNPEGLTVHVQIHPPGGDSHQPRCGNLWATAIVACIGGNCALVVIIHVAADAVTDSGREGIDGHNAG